MKSHPKRLSKHFSKKSRSPIRPKNNLLKFSWKRKIKWSLCSVRVFVVCRTFIHTFHSLPNPPSPKLSYISQLKRRQTWKVSSKVLSITIVSFRGNSTKLKFAVYLCWLKKNHLHWQARLVLKITLYPPKKNKIINKTCTWSQQCCLFPFFYWVWE